MARSKNINLKTPNQELEYTYEQVEELKRCAQDPVYFIRKYIQIQHPVKGAVPFDLYSYQEKMIRAYQENRYTVVLSARQTGKCFFYSTMINTIEVPKGIKKFLLKIVNRKKYDEIFKEM